MKDEIKEILDDMKIVAEHKTVGVMGQQLNFKNARILLDYITNLQEENEELKAELQEEIDSATWWNNRYKALEQVNKKLKVKLNCKECFSSTLPENTEFVILTKENYDRQQKDIELELIDYKQRNEKAIEYINTHYLNANEPELLNILNGGDE